MDEKKYAILESSITVLYGFIILFATAMGLFFFRGIEEIELFEKSTFYWTFLGIGLVAILVLGLLEYLVSIGFFREDIIGWAKLYIWEPDESILGISGLSEVITLKRVLIVSIFFALAMGLFSTMTQTFFVSLPPYELQVSETGQLILNTEPAAMSETITFIVLISLIYGFGRWYFNKIGILNSGSLLIVHFITILMTTLLWIAMHTARYGSTAGIGYTAMFGLFGGILTVFFGTPIPWYFWHLSNNLFLKANDIFVRSNVRNALIIILIVYILIVVLLYIRKIIKK